MAANTFVPFVMTRFHGSSNPNITVTAGDRTVGTKFFILRAGMHVKGARVYSHQATNLPHKISLWSPDGTLLRTVTVTLTAQAITLVSFATAYVVTESDMALQDQTTNKYFTIGIYETSGTSYTESDEVAVAAGYLHTVGVCLYKTLLYPIKSPFYYSVGDAVPATNDISMGVPIDPIIGMGSVDDTYDNYFMTEVYGGSHAGIGTTLGDRTLHVPIFFHRQCIVYGVRFYTHFAGNFKVRFNDWYGAPASFATANISCGSAGTYSALFSSPVSMDTTKLNYTVYGRHGAITTYCTVSVYDTSGTQYTIATSNFLYPGNPISCGYWGYYPFQSGSALYSNGDAVGWSGNIAGSSVPISPIVGAL
jgi:hypothetical protein